MARPRLHTLDDLLDVAEQLVTHGDPAGLTLRSLATASGASNGTIYHAFRSKEDLLAQLWLRASARLGARIEQAVEAHRDDDPQDVVVAVATAPVAFTREYPESAQLFFAQRSDQLFSGDISPDLVASLAAERQRFVTEMVGLAKAAWNRRDRSAVDAIAACVVDIPGGMIRRALIEGRRIDAATERRIDAAVRAVLALPL
ncbi:MAG TPA: TetR/AcrR family transcriptional regulator [Marmoricola sp.]|nr:TetR/AcrR family transcriptional regulator [Marmoricola sp.]